MNSLNVFLLDKLNLGGIETEIFWSLSQGGSKHRICNFLKNPTC